ncbi:29307_t:CDS:2 [Gigaspora margarita]|uniref:29307_t:CDS:1 n=1 Tax=Gigaspora margarita TaxID=4874 RepID=A0ABN7UW32_GIGMA|nr:29307_t:CDS:2 [Gigaspora margarita]
MSSFLTIIKELYWRNIIKKAIDNVCGSHNSSEIDRNEEGKKNCGFYGRINNQIQRNDQLIQIEDDGRPDIVIWTDVLILNLKMKIGSLRLGYSLSFQVIFFRNIEFSKHIELISSLKLKIDDNIIFYELAQISLWRNATKLNDLNGRKKYFSE